MTADSGASGTAGTAANVPLPSASQPMAGMPAAASFCCPTTCSHACRALLTRLSAAGVTGQQMEAAGAPAIGSDAEGRGALAAVPAVPFAPEAAAMHAGHILSQAVRFTRSGTGCGGTEKDCKLTSKPSRWAAHCRSTLQKRCTCSADGRYTCCFQPLLNSNHTCSRQPG